MTLRSALTHGGIVLNGITDADTEARILLKHCAGNMSDMQLLLNMDESISPIVLDKYDELLKRREKREPLQYIIGNVPFLSCDILVDGRVLIPRPETEFMTELCIGNLKGMIKEQAAGQARVLDLCTGSGAIAAAVKKALPIAEVHACDISGEALALAKENASRNNADICFLEGNLFGAVDGIIYDMIISNPPYICSSEMDILQEEVKREPKLALDGGCDGLDIVRRIADEAAAHLARDGSIFVEIGYDQSAAVAELFRRNFNDVNIINDLAGIPRIVYARKPVYEN
jgi:release factor glutamine methyltransferase